MPKDRCAIPEALKRSTLVEAGHRCAIPVCRQVPVEIAHIVPWSKVNEHSPDNLIALCPTCHARYDKGEIDRKSMLQYKSNLEVLNGRYTDTERQVLKIAAKTWNSSKSGHTEKYPVPKYMQRVFGEMGASQFERTSVPEGMWWILSNLLDDEIIVITPYCMTTGECSGKCGPTSDGGHLMLTDKGMRLVGRMVSAEPL
ncbi:HNH endonuclease [Streptomyces xiamenensis]